MAAGTAASPTQGIGTSDGRYTLQHELARGGMGRVWVADDARLSRQVAIKELLDGNGTQRARFDRERSLTSRLEHPSIVSLQDGGTWPDGKPFYVMKLVRGESLDRVIARAQNLTERIALLPHGLAMVDALAYAHAQGIVHRDLKPENVLVGDFGETVVIDWGLAKDLRAKTPDLVEGPYRDLVRVGETLGGEVLGTPAYMPPEQALGDAVDERADVYSLGAVLYHLLSGAAPHRGSSVDDVLASVISDAPPPLARKAPGVPADLVTIVDKAMARDPEARYATAAELASDLKRFQSGQLVNAHHYTGGQLLARWVRRHRAAVIVGACAAITLVALGAASFARIVREQHEAETARGLAEASRLVANDRRAGAERLVTYMLGDLHDSLEPIGKLALLEVPARKALAYFDERKELAPDERESRAVALQHLGSSLRSRGDLAGAETQIRASIAERELLATEHHDRAEWQYVDAALHADLGDLLDLRGASGDAIPEYRAAIEGFAKLAVQRPNDRRGPRGQEQVLEKLGGILVARGDLAGGQREYRAALALATARAAAAPDDLEAQRDLVAPEHAIADALVASGDVAGALVAYRATLARIEALAAHAPDDMLLVRMVQLTQHRIGIAASAQPDAAGAVKAFRAAEELSDRLVAHDPRNVGWQYEQAVNLGRLADALQTAGDVASAIATANRTVTILRSIQVVDPSNSMAARDQLVIEAQLSELLGGQKQWPLAEASAREAVAIGERRAKHDPTNRQAKLDLDEAYAQLGAALLALGRPAEAVDIATRAEGVARALATEAPADAPAQITFEQALVDLGTARCAAHVSGATAAYDDAIALATRQLAAAPKDASWLELDREARARAHACRP